MQGFTRVDNALFERLLTGDLTKRQLKVILLVLRFSTGFQKGYALLRRRDFAYAGLSPSCVKAELVRLAERHVIGWDPARGSVWLNPDLTEWLVEAPEARRRLFWPLAHRNLPKRTAERGQSVTAKLSETGYPLKEREKIQKDSLFISVRDLYETRVAALTEEQAGVLREVAGAYGPGAVREAVEQLASGRDRSFPRFLKALDDIAAHSAPRGGSLSIRASLARYAKAAPKQP